MFCAGAVVRLPWALGDPRGGPAWGTSVALSVALAGQRLDGYHRGEDEGKFQTCSDIVLSPLPRCVRDGPPPVPPNTHTHTGVILAVMLIIFTSRRSRSAFRQHNAALSGARCQQERAPAQHSRGAMRLPWTQTVARGRK